MSEQTQDDECVVLVTGSRYWEDSVHIRQVLESVQEECSEGSRMILVHGNCRGADRLAATEAQKLGWRVISVPARWHTKDPKTGVIRRDLNAGKARNKHMVQMYRPHRVLAFVLPSSRGTWHCINEVEKYGKQTGNRLQCEVKIVRPEDKRHAPTAQQT